MMPGGSQARGESSLRREEGVTGLETAIILIAFVIVASVFAFVVLSTGLFSVQREKQTVIAALEKVSSNVELRGSLTILDNNADGSIDDGGGGGADSIVFNLSTAAAGRPSLLDPAAASSRVVMNLVDSGARVADLTFTVTWISGDGDDLLETGELAQISVDVPSGIVLTASEEWTLEVLPSGGGALLINRVMPAELDVVMDMK